MYMCGKKMNCGFRVLIFCKVFISMRVFRLGSKVFNYSCLVESEFSRIFLMDIDIMSNKFESSKKK